jgi:hypothetical protein
MDFSSIAIFTVLILPIREHGRFPIFCNSLGFLSSEMAKLFQEQIGNTLEHISIGNNFMKRTLIAQQLREKIDKWDGRELKSFCTAKETITKPKRQPRE